MVEIIWTNNAIKDIEDIAIYISKDSLKYANITVQNIFEAVNILEYNPLAGKKVPEFGNEDIRQIVCGKYRIIYFVKSSLRIDVITVHHGAKLNIQL